MTQQQQKKEDETPKKKKSTNPLMAAFKKDRNTPESLEKLRNDAALKSINKGRSNRGQKTLDKLPDTLAKASAARLKAKKSKSTGTGTGRGGSNVNTKPTGAAKYDGLTRSQYLAKLKKQRQNKNTKPSNQVNTTDRYIPRVHKPGEPLTEEGVPNPNYRKRRRSR